MLDSRGLPTPAMPNTVTAWRGALTNSSALENHIPVQVRLSPFRPPRHSREGGNLSFFRAVPVREIPAFAGMTPWKNTGLHLMQAPRLHKRAAISAVGPDSIADMLPHF